jgi:hypothetical protein
MILPNVFLHLFIDSFQRLFKNGYQKILILTYGLGNYITLYHAI